MATVRLGHHGILTGADQRAFLNTVPSHLLMACEKLDFEEHLPGLVVTIETFTPNHSRSQSGYYWAAIRKWGEELGYSAREAETIIHEEVLKEAFGTKRVPGPRGGFIQVPDKRSHDANRTDYSHLIETLIQLASDMGHVIQDPRRAA